MKCTMMAIVTALLAGQVVADIEHGQQLHDKSCMKCHDSSVYSRNDRFVADKDALKSQVQRCSVNVGAQWFDEDVADVTDFLNATYYKFP